MLKVTLRVDDTSKVRNKQPQEAASAAHTSTRRLVPDEGGGQSQEAFGLSGTEEVPLRPSPSKMHSSQQAERGEGISEQREQSEQRPGGRKAGGQFQNREYSKGAGAQEVWGCGRSSPSIPGAPFSLCLQLPPSTSALLSLSVFRSVSPIILEGPEGQGPCPVHLCVLSLQHRAGLAERWSQRMNKNE